MLPGRRTPQGALYVVQAVPPVGTPLVGGIAVRPDGTIYVVGMNAPPPAFDPEDLFQNNEVGVFYDPSDLPTMFQDSAGATPVTADGQPVGLILDKSKGLVLGPELVTNGNPFVAASWTLGSGVAETGGKLVFTASTDNTYQRIAVLDNLTNYYTYTVVLSAVSAGSIKVAVNSSPGFTTVLITAPGTYTFTSRLPVITAYLYIVSNGFTGVVDSVSAKVVTGNHASQATAASRPLKTSTGAADWTNYDAVDDVLNTTFPSSLGSSCTVARANVGAAPTILTGQTIGTSYADSTDNAGLIIVNRALTTQETNDLTAWLLAKGATA